jgi:Uma2 family endonuclease
MQALDVKTPTQINFSPLSRRYTLEEFWDLPEREDHARYNLIGGYLFMVPPPNPPHGSLDARLQKALNKFLLDNNIDGDVHHPNEPIYRHGEGSTYLEPDMMYVSRELSDRMGAKRTSADIVFEYLSRSTAVYDRTTKADTYLLLGVHELWLVDPVTKTVEVRYPNKIDDTAVWEVCIYSLGQHAKSRVLDGWEVLVDELFKDLG